MSDILDLYNNSNAQRVKDARSIPGPADHFFDLQSKIQPGFVVNQPPKKTEFTDDAIHFYDTERKDMVTPESFQPIESGIPLNRYSPDSGYYKPGAPQS